MSNNLCAIMNEDDFKEDQDGGTHSIPKEELEWNIDRLRRSGKLEHIAMVDSTGKILAVSRGMSIGPDDGFTILKVLDSSYRDLTKIKIGKHDFLCFKINDNSMVGRSEEDFLYSCRCQDFVIVGLSDPESQGSSIFEISRYVERFNRRSFLEASRHQEYRRSTLEASPDPGGSSTPDSV